MGVERASPDRDILASTWTPRDGGFIAWSVLAAACICNGVTLGFVFSKSVIYTALLDYNVDSAETNLASKTSLVLSLSTGMIFLMAPVAGFCVNRFGFRVTAFLGAFIAASALLASSFLLKSVPALYATFLLFGTGTSLVEVTSITVLGMHFQRHLGLVNGLVTSSSAVFGSIFPYLMKFLLLKIGLQGLLWSFCGILILSGIIAACVYQIPNEAPKIEKQGNFQLFNRDLWTNKKYVIWCLTLATIWFGYFVPFVHIMKYAVIHFPNEDGYVLSMSLNLPAIVSRVMFGAISDLKYVNTVYLQLVTFLSLGIATIMVPVVQNWPLLITITVCIGLLGGGGSCLLGPIATHLCGIANAPQAIGLMFGLGSLPLIAGPPIAGLLYDHTGSYEIPFFMSGAVIIIGSLLMSTMQCVKHTKTRVES